MIEIGRSLDYYTIGLQVWIGNDNYIIHVMYRCYYKLEAVGIRLEGEVLV